mmetsp:Transcript_3192/g.4427  ORF Transcript_3192/g.4427 Transcript_3192/m.4427 type:complete len:258 (-) Transcript_3192:59-832(-)
MNNLLIFVFLRLATERLVCHQKVRDTGASSPDASYEIIHIDDELIVVNKDANLLTVPGISKDKQDSLLLRLRRELDAKDLHAAHRLDRDTSGLIAFGRTKSAHRALSISFQKREVQKTYIGRVLGFPPTDAGIIDVPIGRSVAKGGAYAVATDGRPSISRYETLARDEHTTLLSLVPVTGRTQQLRIHLAYLGIPLLGDTIHGMEVSDSAASRLCLHATRLEFDDPRGKSEKKQKKDRERLVFESRYTFDDEAVLLF